MLLQEKVQGATLGSFWGCSDWGESVISYLYLPFVPVISSDASVPNLGFLKQKKKKKLQGNVTCQNVDFKRLEDMRGRAVIIIKGERALGIRKACWVRDSS